MSPYTPVSDDEAAELLGVGIHTCLRKHVDTPTSTELWDAIDASPDWGTAVEFAVIVLRQAGYQLCTVTSGGTV